jgi:hypothetical protein
MPPKPRSRTVKTPRRQPPRTRPARPAGLVEGLRELGVLRLGLALLAVAVLVFAPRPGTAAVTSGWPMWSTLIVPTLAPLVFMVLMLDALMARVHMTSVRGAALGRYRRIVIFDLLLGLAVMGYWTPYFLALLRPA